MKHYLVREMKSKRLIAGFFEPILSKQKAEKVRDEWEKLLSRRVPNTKCFIEERIYEV